MIPSKKLTELNNTNCNDCNGGAQKNKKSDIDNKKQWQVTIIIRSTVI